MLKYLFDGAPDSGEVWEIVPGVKWLRMPLPMELDHINLYLLEDDDGWKNCAGVTKPIVRFYSEQG